MSADFVKTDTILDKILAKKAEHIRELSPLYGRDISRPYGDLEIGEKPRDFIGALRKDTVALLAEAKKASPSKGLLMANFDPVQLANTYEENGAAAISVLTDVEFFQGSIDYLREVRAAVDVPVLQKDFIIDACQIYEGRAAGADAALLIVAALTDSQLADLHELIISLGMATLVEVHNEAEMERGLKLGAKLIGINNRDLKTFNVDLETTARLAKLVPDDVVLVAESGLKTADDVYRMGQLGANAVLVGETLVKSDDIAATVLQFSSQKRLSRVDFPLTTNLYC